MAQERRLLIELVNSVCWMFFHSHTRRFWTDEIKLGNLKLPDDIQQGVTFSTPSDDRDLTIGELLNPLGILSIKDSIGSTGYIKFIYPEDTLRAHLEATDRLSLVDFDRLMTTFLSEGSIFGKSFRSSETGKEAIASLPISQSVFQVPTHFQEPINALRQSGFCTAVNGGYLWAEPIRPFMETAYLWRGDQTRDEIREAELTKIWDEMPPKLRSAIMESGLNVIDLACVMSLLLYDGKWHTKPKYKDIDPNDVESYMRGSDLATAIEIGRLYRDGKLQGSRQ